MKRAFLAVAAALLLGGALTACVTATPYQPLNVAAREAGGYRDLKLNGDHWRVSFLGNAETHRETVERYLLYRAAELTVSQGYDWFFEDDQHTDKHTTAYVDPYFGRGWGRFHGGWGGGWGGGPWGPEDVTTFNRYEVSADIVMGHGARPDGKALDAREVMANLGPGIAKPKA